MAATATLKQKKKKSLGVMTPDHRRWNTFMNRLYGPEGCNFHFEPAGSKDIKNLRFTCQALNAKCPLATKILKAMGASRQDIILSREYFNNNGGGCDCEIFFNIDK